MAPGTPSLERPGLTMPRRRSGSPAWSPSTSSTNTNWGIFMSEAEYHRQQAQEALEAKRDERRKARDYVQGEYQRHGLSEQERDEILAMLGIATDEDIDIHDSGVWRRLTTG